MRFSKVVLAVAVLLAAGGCAGSRAHGLQRPSDLGDEWLWGAEAIPTGDVATSTLTIEKFMPARVQPDSVYAYTVRVTNISGGPLNDVVVTDVVPAGGYTLISAEPDAERAGAQLRWRVGTVGAGQSYTIRVTGHIEPGMEPSSCASVTFVQPEQARGATASAAASAAAADKAAADKAASDRAAAERAAADKAAAEKAAADKAAAEKAATEKAAADKAAADKIAAEKAAAAAAAAAATKAAADKAAADKAASDKLAADRKMAADKAAAEKAAAEKAAQAPKLDLSMSMPADACAMEPVVVKMLLRNTGKTKATGVRVVNQFPAGMTVNGKNYVAFNVGELEAGKGREFTVRMRASKPGKVKNTATVTAAGNLKSEAWAESNVWKAVVGVTNKASADTFGLGKEATFTFTVTNSGDRAATDTTLRVTLTGASKVAGASDGGKVTGTTVTWTFGPLEKGVSKTVSARAVRATAGAVDAVATAAAKCADPANAAAKATFK